MDIFLYTIFTIASLFPIIDAVENEARFAWMGCLILFLLNFKWLTEAILAHP